MSRAPLRIIVNDEKRSKDLNLGHSKSTINVQNGALSY